MVLLEEGHLFGIVGLSRRRRWRWLRRHRLNRLRPFHIDRLPSGQQRCRQPPDITEQRLPQRGLVQRRSRMVHRVDEPAAGSAQPSVDLADASVRQVAAQRMATERDDNGGVERLLLAIQVRTTGSEPTS